SKEQTIPVRLGIGHRRCSDGARGASAVVDDDALTKLFAQTITKQARDVVGTATRGKWNHHRNRSVGVGISRMGGQRSGQGACCNRISAQRPAVDRSKETRHIVSVMTMRLKRTLNGTQYARSIYLSNAK